MQLLRTYPREIVIGTAAGIFIGCFAKYFGAAFLILWLILGGQ